MYKRLACMAAALSIAVLILGGCGEGTTSSSGGSSGKDEETPVSLDF